MKNSKGEMTQNDECQWTVVWRGLNPMRGVLWLDENCPGHRNIRYNGGLRPDGQHSKGDSRLEYDEEKGYWTAEVVQ